MTEKEILRGALDEIAGWKNAYLVYPSLVVNQLADIAIKALTDTEDTGGEKCPECGSAEIASSTKFEYERMCHVCHHRFFIYADPLPPKEQDDEAAELVCEWQASKGEGDD